MINDYPNQNERKRTGKISKIIENACYSAPYAALSAGVIVLGGLLTAGVLYYSSMDMNNQINREQSQLVEKLNQEDAFNQELFKAGGQRR